MRTVWLSAASQPAIAQVAIRADTHEGGRLPEGLQALEATDAALLESYRVAAGFCAHAHARLIAAAQKGSILGRKGKQPEWFRAAERVLGAQRQPEQRSAWEPSQGDPLRSPRSRTTEMDASRDWSHLTQGWRGEKRGATARLARANGRIGTLARTGLGDGASRSNSWVA